MIHRTIPSWQVIDWQEELRDLITCPQELAKYLELDLSTPEIQLAVNTHFPLRVTHSYASKIKKNAPKDPLLLQVLPLSTEDEISPGYCSDPLMEKAHSPCPGIVHKYQSRVLFIATSQCAIHCRYCFRKHFPYSDHKMNHSTWLSALSYVENDRSINEVILSGGDPFSLPDRQLAWLIKQIENIDHVSRIRFHTRYPVTLPSRFTDRLIDSLCSSRLKPIIVTHCNHAQEIDKHTIRALEDLKNAKITLLNQSVLLKNINNDPNILVTLSESLFNVGVLPYYLHQLDKTNGTGHFEVPDNEARKLYKEMLDRLPGYLVPKLVREIPNMGSKTPLDLA